MIRLGLAGILSIAVSAAYAQGAAQKDKDPLGVPPEQAVKQAIDAGDKRFLLAPSCNEMLPGFPLDRNPFVGPDRVEMRNLGPKCEELLGPELYKRLQTTRSYAEHYNRLLFEALQKQPKAPK